MRVPGSRVTGPSDSRFPRAAAVAAVAEPAHRVPAGMLLIRTPGRGGGDRQPDASDTTMRSHLPRTTTARPPVIYASGRTQEPAGAAAARPITRSQYATALPSQGVQRAPQAAAKGAASGGC